ncbi:EAL domain-containing protein [Silicimonas algicola]|uniref:Diguanylate cyclase/phosphodiesterase n=1 Tax=Silicimonas algicola TaxID=1826607 RepID=A0A316GDU2_9RHOB|nr:EAL domain-containing protein [Silicimonas algicola]AZQ66702.1 EAL domain-containing protein [Silicimonas algicola]PWK59058.1 diguanylate cyclase/phosphodiesterase [Silicimonas algicola]
MVPAQILDQIPEKCVEGLALALASDADGAVMELQWCNKAFTQITGYEPSEVVGKRGTILIGPNVEQGKHLRIIENLMNWERFSIKVLNNRKNGEQYWQRMSWAPLSDASNGNRWWLCSIARLESSPAELVQSHIPEVTSSDQAVSKKLRETIRRLEKENQRLHALAKSVAQKSVEDPLTGLSNRRHFEVELTTWIANLNKKGAAFSVFYIDLDRFKSVNDTLGHDAGDKVLVCVANMLRRLTEPSDLVARLGGDEFVVLKLLGNSALKISSIADEIVQEMKEPFTFEGKLTWCSASVGVAIANAGMEYPEQVVADADAALYHAKSQGKGRWSFFTEEMHNESVAIKQLSSDLLVACEKRQFIPFFQPVIDAVTGSISCAEVLVRWAHATRGILPPDAFLDTATNIGILKKIDEIVFGYLHEALAYFDATGVDLPRVAVNISAGRLADPSFIHDIKSSHINPERLIVEILESVYLERMGDVVRWALDELDDLGVTVAIDDFGTGHASVQGLLKIRPAILKIDRQFIQPIVKDNNSRALVSSIVGIGKSLGMKIVAEGVETEEHARRVKKIGCDYLQGFYFGKPMCADDLRDKLIATGGKFWSPMTARPRRLGRLANEHR